MDKIFPYIFPKIVCLCGSTRFLNAFRKIAYEETLKGNIVLTVEVNPNCSDGEHSEKYGVTEEQKEIFKVLHRKKIDLADEIIIVNQGGYIGESTTDELVYAKKKGKIVRFLEQSLD